MATYPTITGGISMISRPWSYDQHYHNVHNDMPHGFRYSFNLRATPLKLIRIEYTNLPDADVTTILNFFIARKGPWEDFDFVFPETGAFPGTTLTKCRFAQDALDIRHIGYNQNSVNVVIQEHA